MFYLLYVLSCLRLHGRWVVEFKMFQYLDSGLGHDGCLSRLSPNSVLRWPRVSRLRVRLYRRRRPTSGPPSQTAGTRLVLRDHVPLLAPPSERYNLRPVRWVHRRPPSRPSPSTAPARLTHESCILSRNGSASVPAGRQRNQAGASA